MPSSKLMQFCTAIQNRIVTRLCQDKFEYILNIKVAEHLFENKKSGNIIYFRLNIWTATELEIYAT